MAQQNPRLIGIWTIPVGQTIELLPTNADANTFHADGWPTAKCNVEIGALTAVNYNIGFGKTTPATNSLWIPRLSGATMILNSISNIGATATNTSADSVWVNGVAGTRIYVFATNESV